jgi:hypothetical protein
MRRSSDRQTIITAIGSNGILAPGCLLADTTKLWSAITHRSLTALDEMQAAMRSPSATGAVLGVFALYVVGTFEPLGRPL